MVSLQTLFDAIDRNSCELISTVLGAYPSMLLAEFRGFTPVSYAAQSDLETLQCVVELGKKFKVNPDELFIADSEYSKNPLMSAVEAKRPKNVEYLLREHQFDQDDENIDGYSALHLAVGVNSVDIVKMLLYYGADPNIPDRVNGNSPLAYAVMLGNRSVLEVLLKNGADSDMPALFDEDGDFEAISFYVKRRHPELTPILNKYKRFKKQHISSLKKTKRRSDRLSHNKMSVLLLCKDKNLSETLSAKDFHYAKQRYNIQDPVTTYQDLCSKIMRRTALPMHRL